MEVEVTNDKGTITVEGVSEVSEGVVWLLLKSKGCFHKFKLGTLTSIRITDIPEGAEIK